ncbi:MAG: histone deacetylase [Thermodesulfatator sp.]|nr:MAG: histone deacetylase [Thermodesulfatator sp.]
MKVGLVYDDLFLQHKPGDYHPERPERLIKIRERLQQEDLAPWISWLAPRRANKEEILWNHSEAYYERVASTAGKPYVQLDPDTATSEASFEAALHAVGAQFVALDELFRENFRSVFCLVRPPGHHAEYDRAMGFCLFNNAALAAHYALKVLKFSRVLLVDWDLHHGNGTQHSFYPHPEVLYFSTHQFPYYPGTGRLEEVGQGEGTGYTVNVPLPAGCGDAEYLAVFEEILRPVARAFRPEVVIVSAGFDPYEEDPLGGMRVSSKGFGALAGVVREIAEESAEGKVLLTLEGGYSLSGLAESVAQVIRVLAGADKPEIKGEPSAKFRQYLEDIKRFFSRYWPL